MTIQKISYHLTGYDAVDLLNQELFDVYNDLLSAASIGMEALMVEEIFIKLNHYATVQFPEEESLMLQYEYPDFSYHQLQHHAFIKLESQLTEEYQANGLSKQLLAKLISFLTYWLYVHIIQYDAKMTGYFDSNQETYLDSYSV